METAKLTLRPSRRVVELAHQMAAEDGTSVTQMFSAFILARHAHRIVNLEIPIGPIARSVTGIMKVPEGWDYRKDLEESLEEKYGRAGEKTVR